MKRRLSMMTAALLAALFVLSCVLPSLFESISADVQIPDVTGSDISGFSTETIKGEPVDGSVFGQYKITVLHYFATWSRDCIRELGYMQHAFEELFPNVNVLGILHEDATSTPDAARELMEEYGMGYGCLIPDAVLTRLVTQLNYIPQTFLISEEGIVLEHFPGVFSGYDSLLRHIEHWTGELKPKYTLRFIDGITGQRIAADVTVEEGGDAVPPEPVVHPGFEFNGWSGNYTNVYESCDIIATYLFVGPIPEPGDVDVDGRVTVADALMTARCAMQLMTSPSVDTFGDMDGDKTITIGDSLQIIRKAIEV